MMDMAAKFGNKKKHLPKKKINKADENYDHIFHHELYQKLIY